MSTPNAAEPIVCESSKAYTQGRFAPCLRAAEVVLLVVHQKQHHTLRVCEPCAGTFELRRGFVLDRFPIGELASTVDGWLPMDKAPTDGTVIEGFYGPDVVRIRWAEERHCMLYGVAPGTGILGEGWEQVDEGLYIDDPLGWRYVE